MVTCDLMGRLGNQLFQMSAAICHAAKIRSQYCLPVKTLNETHWPKYLPVGPCCNGEAKTLVEFREKDHGYNDIGSLDNIRLHGFFQSEKYFRMCRKEIVEKFGLRWYFKQGWVSIHVRRGDYLLYPDKHPLMTNEYYANAVEYMFKRGYKKFLIFSDDIAHCRKIFALLSALLPECRFEYSTGRTEIEDLQEMSSCEHNITCNSTFSWWAAWLNRNPYKMVVAPSEQKWFGPGNAHLSTKDLIPETWIRM